MEDSSSAFQGFRPEAFQFLIDLAFNNERSWFQPRKADYERLLKRPLEAFCAALAPELAARGIPLASDPARSPFRIHRDVRFSKDKSPYKTAASARFPWTGEGGEVGGYLHLEPGNVFVGGGMWHPAPPRLAAWRGMVVEEGDRVHAVIDDPAFRVAFEAVDGDRLTRAPKGFPADHPDIELLRLTDVTFGRRLSDSDAMSPALVGIVADALEAGVPLLRLLATLPDAQGGARWLGRGR